MASPRILAGSVLAGTSLLVLLAARSAAETPQTVGTTMGAISGTVTDTTGAAVNNVTVVISGNALMGPRTSSTNEDGYYRFAAVVPGIYRIEFRLEGFAEIRRDDIHVAIGATATVDESLPIAAVAETVDVARRHRSSTRIPR